MKLKKIGFVVGISAALVLAGCQNSQPVDQEQVKDTGAEASETLDYSEGFETAKQALHAYMSEIVEKDYEKAYEALYEIDKETFSVEEFSAYQASMQLAKDVHGYSIHDEQTFWDFDFGGVTFEQVDFFDLDYAYLENGADPLPVSAADDHGHDEGSDYHSHNHGHEMATMGVAAVKRNGDWFILQGLSEYELKDLTRKYTNQSIALNMQTKEDYALGEAAPVGNMIITVNSVKRSADLKTYILDVGFLNTGFDPLDTDYFISKFAMIDSNLMNYLSQPVDEVGALNGFVRAGSYARGKVSIPVGQEFESDSVYFLMNTIDPSRKPLRFDISKEEPSQMEDLYKQMLRKPEAKAEEKSYIDGLMLSVTSTAFSPATKTLKAPEGWEVLSFDLELNGLSDELIYTNQIDVTLRTADGVSRSVRDQILADKIEGLMTINEQIQALVRTEALPVELTLSIRDTRPNNSITLIIEK